MEILGIDIGGSGIKGAIVDVESGSLVTERLRIPTPKPATPDAVSDVVAQIGDEFGWNGAIGCTFPAIIKNGVAHSAANVHKSWIGTDAQRLIQRKTGDPVKVVNDGQLLPNTELGHLEIRGKIGENRASDRIREQKDLSWKKWATRLSEYIQHVEFLFSPDLFIIGGGVSKKYDKYFKYLDIQTEIVPAQLRNEAGIIGAAMAARELI